MPVETHPQDHVRAFFTEHLIDASRVFDGDLQQALILAVIACMHMRAGVGTAVGRPDPPPAITASCLSRLTAIPRQTVRRKLLGLKAKGWLYQDQQRAWRLAMRHGHPNALFCLADFDARGINRAIRLVRLLRGAR